VNHNPFSLENQEQDGIFLFVLIWNTGFQMNLSHLIQSALKGSTAGPCFSAKPSGLGWGRIFLLK
jgi:hypothetical protein